MSKNCIRCGFRDRTDIDLKCDDCRELEMLRKVSAFVLGKIWIEAKEAAGYGTAVKAKEKNANEAGLQ